MSTSKEVRDQLRRNLMLIEAEFGRYESKHLTKHEQERLIKGSALLLRCIREALLEIDVLSGHTTYLPLDLDAEWQAHQENQQ